MLHGWQAFLLISNKFRIKISDKDQGRPLPLPVQNSGPDGLFHLFIQFKIHLMRIVFPERNRKRNSCLHQRVRRIQPSAHLFPVHASAFQALGLHIVYRHIAVNLQHYRTDQHLRLILGNKLPCSHRLLERIGQPVIQSV